MNRCPHCGAELPYDRDSLGVFYRDCDSKACVERDREDDRLQEELDHQTMIDEGTIEDPLGWDESLTESKYDSAPLANKGPFHEAWDREEDQLKIDDEQGYLERDDPIGPDLDQFDDTE